MKPNRIIAITLGLAGLLGLGTPEASARLEVSAGIQINVAADFYAPLGTGGVWIESSSYGRCWRPAGVAVDWRPYCNGYWEWTDVGWYWVSDEPWAWACYHYGRWFYEPGQGGWIWVPDVEWAPAWVSWRSGEGYVGWAPMGPRAGLFSWHRSEPVYVFVEAGRMHERVTPRTVIVNNATIINRTSVVPRMRQETRTVGNAGPRKVMYNEGPGLATIEKATGNKMRPVSVVEVEHHSPAPSTMQRHPVELPQRSVVTPPVVREPAREPVREVPRQEVVRPVAPREPEHTAPVPTRPVSPVMPPPQTREPIQPVQPRQPIESPQSRQPIQPVRPQPAPKAKPTAKPDKVQTVRPDSVRPDNGNDRSGGERHEPK